MSQVSYATVRIKIDLHPLIRINVQLYQELILQVFSLGPSSAPSGQKGLGAKFDSNQLNQLSLTLRDDVDDEFIDVVDKIRNLVLLKTFLWCLK